MPAPGWEEHLQLLTIYSNLSKANITSWSRFGCVIAINHCKGIQNSTALDLLLGLGPTPLKNKPWQELSSP